MTGGIKREGDRQVSEPTDPDYTDRHLNQLVQDFKECPNSWKECFLGGLSNFERDYVLKHGQ